MTSKAVEVRGRWLMAAFLLTVVLLPGRIAAVTQLDYIVAVVDDDVVLASELVSRLDGVRQQLEASTAPLPSDDVLYSQMLERLIMESLQIQMGERMGIRVDDAQLTQAIVSIAQNNNMTLEQFQEVLVRDGVSYRLFRDDVRREMVVNQVQRARVNNRVHISEQEVEAFLASPVGRDMLSDEYQVGHILLLVPDNAEPADVSAAEQEASEIYAELVAGADFRQMAITRSAGSRALEGGDLGWRKAGELPSLFSDLVIELDKGETASPVRSGRGYHIIQLLDSRGAGNQQVEQGFVYHILVQPSEIRTEAETEALIDDIRARIVAGEDFGDLARQYSQDPGSALAGGELGWAESRSFVPEFQAVMDSVEIDQLSQAFRTDHGWHVLKVTERREHDMSDEALRNMAIRILHNRRFDEELQNWLGEIRDEAYVEIRLQTAQAGNPLPDQQGSPADGE